MFRSRGVVEAGVGSRSFGQVVLLVYIRSYSRGGGESALGRGTERRKAQYQRALIGGEAAG